ncbi:hypothetical protein WN944_005848 [Citrus x changshan-huyou]|uniref:PROP1-like PPR domain-containing protein n=1 Tax=Citrus x changshan-huyou TaxID=2935761 RepID=A0AAP0MKK8_9ROSI
MEESDHAAALKWTLVSETMQNLGLQPSSHRYDGFSRAIVSDRGFDERMEVEVNVPNELSTVCNCGSMSWRFIFKYMKSCGIPPNAATHNIMIDCCSIIRCFKSASAIVSMMVREGFYPQTMTYTALVKILLEYGDFDQALINLLDHVTAEGIQLDVTVVSTTLQSKHCRFGNCVTKTPILQRFQSESYIYSCSLAVKMVCYTWVPTSWSPDQSLWARRLSTNSDTRQK